MKQVWRLVAFALLAADVVGIIYPAFIQHDPGQPPPSVTQTLISIFREPHFDRLEYIFRVIMLLLFAAIAYVLVVTWAYRRVPLTVVKTTVQYKLNSDYSRADVSREQILRANQPGVNAHFSTLRPHRGRIPRANLTMDAMSQKCRFSSSFDLTGTESSGFEIVHDFGGEMPYAWYMIFAPASEIKKRYHDMLSLIRDKLVLRTVSYTLVDEYNGSDPVISFTANTYPQLNISVALEFDGNIPATLRARIIKSNAVVEVPISKSGRVASVFVPSLKNEALRFSWKNIAASTQES